MRSRRALLVAALLLLGIVTERGDALEGGSLRGASASTKSWLVSVERRNDAAEVTGERSCTGAEIEPGIVLTAAHCVEGAEAALLLVRTAGGEVRGVREYLMHPRHQEGSTGSTHDIAVIELDAPIGNRGFPVLAGTGRLTPGNGRGVVHGWNGDRAVSATMSAASAAASRWYRTFRARYQTALQGGRTVACHGDSGAPMTRRSRDGRRVVLAGVLSYGSSECDQRLPVVFTRVETNRGFLSTSARQLRGNLETRTWRTIFGDGSITEASLQSGPRGTTLVVADATTHLTSIAVERGDGSGLLDVSGCVLSENSSAGLTTFDLDPVCLRGGAVAVTVHVSSFGQGGIRTGAAILNALRP